MLKSIRCDQFLESQVEFSSGLNVVLGDENASNSIGKSIFLMVLDFALGGNDLINKKKEVVNELGEHYYDFCLEFNGHNRWFRRHTSDSDNIYPLNSSGDQAQPLTRSEYTNYLRDNYSIRDETLSFRGSVSFATRIWGKDNLSVSRPLHANQQANAPSCLKILLGLFDRYNIIKSYADRIDLATKRKKAITQAAREDIIPSISKKKYDDNLDILSTIDEEVANIRNHLGRFSLSISELVQKDMLDLQAQKRALDKRIMILESQLRRIKHNLSGRKYLRSKNMQRLVEFFPDINTDRLNNIEEFHSSIASILKSQLLEAESLIENELGDTQIEFRHIIDELEKRAPKVDNPGEVVNRIYDLSRRSLISRRENEFYERKQMLADEQASAKQDHEEAIDVSLKYVTSIINEYMENIVESVYIESRRSPELSAGSKWYLFKTYEDSGTGKAYSDLIVLDLALLNISDLPLLIHDSLLFKNIENTAVPNLIDQYVECDKQCFIAIDEIDKYGSACETLLRNKAVLSLSATKLLYVKDWRPPTSTE